MSKFISVLNPTPPATFLTAVQWADSLAALKANHYYNAGVNLTLPKTGNEVNRGTVTITEVNTQQTVNATIFELSAQSTQFVRMASNKASKRFLKTLIKIGGNNEL